MEPFEITRARRIASRSLSPVVETLRDALADYDTAKKHCAPQDIAHYARVVHREALKLVPLSEAQRTM